VPAGRLAGLAEPVAVDHDVAGDGHQRGGELAPAGDRVAGDHGAHVLAADLEGEPPAHQDPCLADLEEVSAEADGRPIPARGADDQTRPRRRRRLVHAEWKPAGPVGVDLGAGEQPAHLHPETDARRLREAHLVDGVAGHAGVERGQDTKPHRAGAGRPGGADAGDGVAVEGGAPRPHHLDADRAALAAVDRPAADVAYHVVHHADRLGPAPVDHDDARPGPLHLVARHVEVADRGSHSDARVADVADLVAADRHPPTLGRQRAGVHGDPVGPARTSTAVPRAMRSVRGPWPRRVSDRASTMRTPSSSSW
jgi:hypothetical protein